MARRRNRGRWNGGPGASRSRVYVFASVSVLAIAIFIYTNQFTGQKIIHCANIFCNNSEHAEFEISMHA